MYNNKTIKISKNNNKSKSLKKNSILEKNEKAQFSHGVCDFRISGDDGAPPLEQEAIVYNNIIYNYNYYNIL